MKPVLLRSAIISAAAIAAFGLGRAWPRPPTTMIAAGAAPPTHDEATTATPPASREPRSSVPRRRAAERDAPATFDRARGDNAEAAARLRSDVVVTVSERRRRHNPAVRACVDGGALTEDALLRFSVEVHAVDGRAEVGPATIVEVLEGPPLGDETLACLLSAMDQRETIELELAVTYHGTIDVPIRFAAIRAP